MKIIEEKSKKIEAHSYWDKNAKVPPALLSRFEHMLQDAGFDDIPTLKSRHNDRLDFHEIGVESLAKLLYGAYQDGYDAAMSETGLNS